MVEACRMSARKPKTHRNPRTQRALEALHSSCVELTLKKGWPKVKVQEICLNANVSRATFYLHFADKDDVLISGLERVLEQALSANTTRPFERLLILLTHAGDSRKLFRAVIGKQAGLAVQDKFRAVVRTLVGVEVSAFTADVHSPDIVDFLSGALVQMVHVWVSAGSEKPRRSAAELLQAFESSASRLLSTKPLA